MEINTNMTIDKILSNVNYNIKKIVEELRFKIGNISDTNETIDERQITYQYLTENFCTIKIKKDHLEIDFIAGNTIEDPIKFSWKIKPNEKNNFNRRLQIKNIRDIDTVFGLILQYPNIGKK